MTVMRTVAALHVAAVCLAGALAVPVSAQLALADLQRVEEADVDADVDGTTSRRVCLNASAYVLAVEGVQLNGTFYGEGMLVLGGRPRRVDLAPGGPGRGWGQLDDLQRRRAWLLHGAGDHGPRPGLPPAGRGRLGRPEPAGAVAVGVTAAARWTRSTHHGPTSSHPFIWLTPPWTRGVSFPVARGSVVRVA